MKPKLLELIEDMRYRATGVLKRAWLIAKHRPIVTCPFCKGQGGSVDYWGEWCECRECWKHWSELDDCHLHWFIGRLPLWQWCKAKISMWAGFWFICGLVDVVRCKIGLHRWMNEFETEPGLKICSVCYQHKYDPVDSCHVSEED